MLQIELDSILQALIVEVQIWTIFLKQVPFTRFATVREVCQVRDVTNQLLGLTTYAQQLRGRTNGDGN